MNPKRFEKISNFLNARQKDLTLLTDGVNKGQNLSALLRHCDAFAVNQMHIVTPNDDRFEAFKRTCAGSANWVPVQIYENSQQALDYFKQSNQQIVVAHLSEQSKHYQEIDYTIPTVIVMGSEISGASKEVLDQADYHVQIPMCGMVDSLNVSAACAILLSEAYNQRFKKGMFNFRSLSDEEYSNRLFEYGYPKMAKILQQENKPYPALDEFGQLV